jgi:hypothetical protein
MDDGWVDECEVDAGNKENWMTIMMMMMMMLMLLAAGAAIE